MEAIKSINSGLTDEQVLNSRLKYGKNNLVFKTENLFITSILNLLKDPMIILLLAAALIYFVMGEVQNSFFMIGAIFFVAGISIFQNNRSQKAIEKLKHFTQPNCKVIRNGKTIEIKSEDLVIDDLMIIEEGDGISADGKIIHSTDLSINESILTGESLSVVKDKDAGNPIVYKGTTVSTGMALVSVTHIGNKTQLGEIGESLQGITIEKTPLEKQISYFVKGMVIVGLVVFVIVLVFNYYRSGIFMDSLLKSLTLAMSILPEEIPVAFTTFMAMGAWRLMKFGVAVKQIKTVETLGSATVICTDKTGTLTENKMKLAKLFTLQNMQTIDASMISTKDEIDLVSIAMWASEPIPFDPMEKALHKAYEDLPITDQRGDFRLVFEYPLAGKPPMMTHVFSNGDHKIIACKGAPEAIVNVCNLTAEQKNNIYLAIDKIAVQGYRVLGVAHSSFNGDTYPKLQQEFPFNFNGIIAFYDPPKQNISVVLKDFYKAGIEVKIITGDNKATTSAIAKQIGFKGYENAVSGEELMRLPKKEFDTAVKENSIFCRMFPEAKLKIVESLKSNHNIVAMIGDGVNDGPALKAANIGIAMGKKGTEIAKQASALILLEDDLSKLVDAIAMGRRIYANLKKAIQYIISIHIPIILTVFIPLALGWVYPNIFSPIHIIFLELIMGPTCSIVYENDPMEKRTMAEPPRAFTNTFFTIKELSVSVIQGLAITVGVLAVYQYAVFQNLDEPGTRTMIFITLITANVFLTLVNRSFIQSVFTTLHYKNKLLYGIISLTIIINVVILSYEPLTAFFKFKILSSEQILISIVTGVFCVLWYEIVKYKNRSKQKINTAQML